jgi:hypothetical protein
MCHRPLSRLGASSVCTSFKSGRSFVSQRTEVMCHNRTRRAAANGQSIRAAPFSRTQGIPPFRGMVGATGRKRKD